MNDDINTTMSDAEAAAINHGPVRSMPMVFHAQYVRDVSFENPQPATLYEGKGTRPVMDVGFSIECQTVPSEQFKHMYEVQVGVKVHAKRDDKTAFIAEVLYAVLVTLDDVPENQHHPLLYIEVPRYAFPYVRMLISDLTQNAGMLPLMLAPVDFRMLYMQRFGEDIRKSQEQNRAAG